MSEKQLKKPNSLLFDAIYFQKIMPRQGQLEV
jgi:hypothetical protein